MFRLILGSMLAALLAACASAPPAAAPQVPELRLPPSAAMPPLALQQRLEFTYGDRVQTLDALLESDPEGLSLALHLLGRPLLSLRWDGRDLQQTRYAELPPALRAESVLSDLQWVYWPAAEIRAQLPAGWRLEEGGQGRRLLRGDREWLRVERDGDAVIRLEHRDLGYRLRIESVPVQP